MLYRFMQDGGPIMWPIAGLSCLATMFMFERIFYWVRYSLRRDRTLRRDVMDGRLTSDLELIRSRDPVAECAHWFRVDADRGRIMSDRVVGESRRWIGLLEGIAGLSTSLGLFGTVVGVSMSFDSMALGKSDDVAHGLSVALYTTVAGLINYLYCFTAASFFRHFSESLEDELDVVERMVKVQNRPAEARPAAAPIYNVVAARPMEPQIVGGGRG